MCEYIRDMASLDSKMIQIILLFSLPKLKVDYIYIAADSSIDSPVVCLRIAILKIN
jgi:hypothetical protein